MSTFLYLSLVTISFLLTLKLLFKSRALKNLPPGPPYLPLIGNLHQLKQPFHRAFYELSRKYGKLFSLWFGSRLVVVVSSQTAAQECFSKNDIVLANRPHFLTGKYIGYNNTTLVLSPYGDHWRNLRRIATLEVLSTHRINSFLEIRRDEIMRLVQKLAQECSNGFNKVELRSKLSEMTFNTIMRMVSGKRYYGEDCDVTDVEEARRFRAITKELVALGGANNPGDFISVLRWFDFDGLENKLKRISNRTDSFLQGLIDEHRNGKRNTNTMIDHLLTQQQSHPEYYTDQIIKGLIMVMLLAGTDTSSVTLEWAMSNLLNHPEILERARKEIDTEIGQDHLIDESDISKLNYLQNIVYETFRLHPAAPLLVPHLSSEDCTLEGYKVPQNTIVLVNAWAIHRDPKVWSDDSTQFKPERFEKEGEINNLLTFGIGRRACPGANLAQRTVNLTLGLLIQCFEWERTTHAEIDMAEGKGLTVSRKIPLEAMFRCVKKIGVCEVEVMKNIANLRVYYNGEVIPNTHEGVIFAYCKCPLSFAIPCTMSFVELQNGLCNNIQSHILKRVSNLLYRSPVQVFGGLIQFQLMSITDDASMQQMFCIYQQTRFHVPMIELYVEFEQQSGSGAVSEEVNVDELGNIYWEEDNNDSEEEFEAKSMTKTMTETWQAIRRCKMKRMQL
ncbi:hypothetical protein Ahy_B05g079634 [Arachis hypogaea]|uniref:Cytochrome P450 n=1 Tax=Arachis hypogaea TaxID=3818 RepID=A0A444ZAK4_ARAHY|nr:hypothetical protein Ahy_B05g079634 [Arachis hypogaea]